MENKGESQNIAAARQTLSSLDEDRARAAVRVRAPLWYRAALSLAVVAFIRAFGLPDSTFIVIISISAAVAVLLGVIRPWVTGTQADPWATGPALRWGIAQTLAVLTIGAAGIGLFTVTELEWVLWISAVLAGATCFWSATRMENSLAHSIRESRS